MKNVFLSKRDRPVINSSPLHTGHRNGTFSRISTRSFALWHGTHSCQVVQVPSTEVSTRNRNADPQCAQFLGLLCCTPDMPAYRLPFDSYLSNQQRSVSSG